MASSKNSMPFWKQAALVGTLFSGLGLTASVPRHETTKRQEVVTRPNWIPAVGDDWQLVLKGEFNIADNWAYVWDIDLFETSAETIKQLHDADRRVICYFSAGTYEDWRDDLKSLNETQLAEFGMGQVLVEWEGETWWNTNSPKVRELLVGRVKLAAEKGCDAIDPDNIDGYDNKNSLNLTKADAIDLMKFLQQEAIKYGMATGLKNSATIIPDVISFLDFSVNEQCVEHKECNDFAQWITAGKPVFNVEYPLTTPVNETTLNNICSASGTKGMSMVMKDKDATAAFQYCPNMVGTGAIGLPHPETPIADWYWTNKDTSTIHE